MRCECGWVGGMSEWVGVYDLFIVKNPSITTSGKPVPEMEPSYFFSGDRSFCKHTKATPTIGSKSIQHISVSRCKDKIKEAKAKEEKSEGNRMHSSLFDEVCSKK